MIFSYALTSDRKSRETPFHSSIDITVYISKIEVINTINLAYSWSLNAVHVYRNNRA